MINGKRIVVIMPAYNAEKTLIQTYKEIPQDVVDEIILTDDNSTDRTVEVAKKLNLKYDLIFCIGNSLVHLDGEKEIEMFLEETKKLLADRGSLIIQVLKLK